MNEQVKTVASLICPECGKSQTVLMPLDACQFFYKCVQCAATLKPKKGDCCVFCSYSDSKCPSKQIEV